MASQLTIEKVHSRLRILEAVTLLSLLLNLALWFFAGQINSKADTAQATAATAAR